jgi:hypothetical protein
MIVSSQDTCKDTLALRTCARFDWASHFLVLCFSTTLAFLSSLGLFGRGGLLFVIFVVVIRIRGSGALLALFCLLFRIEFWTTNVMILTIK